MQGQRLFNCLHIYISPKSPFGKGGLVTKLRFVPLNFRLGCRSVFDCNGLFFVMESFEGRQKRKLFNCLHPYNPSKPPFDKGGLSLRSIKAFTWVGIARLFNCLHIYIPPKSPFGKGGLNLAFAGFSSFAPRHSVQALSALGLASVVASLH